MSDTAVPSVTVPFSRAQARLWRLERLAAAKSKPNAVLCYRVDGVCEVDALRAALRDIVAAQPDFHSRLSVQDDAPAWRREALESVELVCTELVLPAADAHLPLPVQRAWQTERVYAFALEREAPLRLRWLADAAGARAWLLLTFHPLVMTRAGLEQLARRVETQFGASRPDMPVVQCTDAVTRDAYIEQAAAARVLLEFPTDRARSPIKDFTTASFTFRLDAAELPLDESPYLALLTAFAVGIGRYAQQSALTLGVADLRDAGRAPAHAATTFEHVLARCALMPVSTFGDVRAALAQSLELAFAAARDVALESLPSNGAGLHDMAVAPFCQFAFSYREPETPPWQVGAVTWRRCVPAEPERSFSHSELELHVEPASEGGLLCRLEYSSALFEHETAVAFCAHLRNLLAAVCSEPQRALDECDLMSDAERAALFTRSGPVQELPVVTLERLFARQALRQPEAIALVDGSHAYSFGVAQRYADALAEHLAARGIGEGDRVGVYLPRSAAFVIAVLAVLQRGAVYVPLDPGFGAARADAIIADGDLRCVLHDLPTAHDDPRWLRFEWRLAAASPPLESITRSIDAPVYVLYTSGSSGRPKGVIGTHRAVLNRLVWAEQALALAADDVFCLSTKTVFVDHVAEMFQPLLHGRRLVIAPDATVLDAAAFAALIARERITRLTQVPFALARLLDAAPTDALAALRSITCSGDVLDAALARRCLAALPATRLFNLYGLTETGADSSCAEITAASLGDLADFFRGARVGAALGVPDDGGESAFTVPDVSMDALRARFAATELPAAPRTIEAYMAWLERDVLPYVVDVGRGTFIGHMTSALPDFMVALSAMVARLNQNMVKVETSKSLTLLERQLLAMLHKEFFAQHGYAERIQDPEHVFGLIVSGGTSANITALWNARQAAVLALGYDKAELIEHGAPELLRRSGYEGCAIISSRLAHYSLRKAASLLGLGERHLVYLRQDAQQRADCADLEAKLTQCRAERRLPIAVVGIAGSTETGVIDPLPQMAAIAARHGVHFHVDAAWGGAMIFSERYRGLLDGIERADTITLCPHKQLYVPQGISLCLFKDSQRLHASSVQANYQGRRGSFDAGQYTLEGSRPAIFLALHAMLSIVSKRGVGALIEQGIALTRHFAELIDKHPAFELVAPPQINILNYRYIPRALRPKRHYNATENRVISAAVGAIQQRQFLNGKTFVSRTDLMHQAYGDERITVFRVVIANPLTTPEDLRATLADQLEIAAACVETTSAEASAEPWHEPEAWQRRTCNAVPIGRPIANTEILVLDARRRLLPAGLVGELYVGGDGLAAGYVECDATPAAFVPHPYKPAARLLRTGDFGRWRADGQLEFAGRRDQQVKIRGMRVEFAEVEAALLALAEVKHAVVLAEQRESDTRLVAYVVPVATMEIPVAAFERTLRRRLIATLPLHLVPPAIVLLDTLPALPSGKVDRRALHAAHAAGDAPQTRLEHGVALRLRAIWQRLLDRDDIAIEDDFFEVGGHSLAIAALQGEIRREFGLLLSLQTLYEHTRLEHLAQHVDALRDEALSV